MKSPIIQDEMQKMVFMDFAKELYGFPSRFLGANIHFLIAISDNGIIEWPKQGPLKGVHKADQICNVVKDIIGSTLQDDAEPKIPDDLFDQWCHTEVAQGRTPRIPSKNLVAWLAQFLVTTHQMAEQLLATLECPHDSIADVWQYADVSSKREVLISILPVRYRRLWRTTAEEKIRMPLQARLAARCAAVTVRAPRLPALNRKPKSES